MVNGWINIPDIAHEMVALAGADTLLAVIYIPFWIAWKRIMRKVSG
jgi:hypothetical protein